MERGGGVVNGRPLWPSPGAWTERIVATPGVDSATSSRPRQPMIPPMWLDSDDALRAHLEALTVELGRLADRLQRGAAPPRILDDDSSGPALVSPPPEAIRTPRSGAVRIRLDALHRLAVVAEDHGWLDAGEAIVLRKLAFRVAFYLRRRDSTLP